MRVAGALAAVAGAAVLYGCAATGALYQKLDWFAAWRLDDYVSLDATQKAQFDRDFDVLWRWHRTEQLPLYARDLRQIASRVAAAATPEIVAEYSDRFQQHWELTMVRLRDPACALVRTFRAEQVSEVLDELDDNIDEFAEEYVEPPEHELRRNSRKRVTRWITRWTGDLNKEQKAILQRWERERRNVGADWLDYRREWRGALERVLEQRQSPSACARLEPLMVRPLDLRSRRLAENLEYNEGLWRRMIADLVNAMDDKQRRATIERVNDLAAELEALSRKAP